MTIVLAVLATLGVLGAAALAPRIRESRAASEIRAAHADLRDATFVLAKELRGVVRTDTLQLAADTAVEFFAPLLNALTCDSLQNGRLLLVPLGSVQAGPAVSLDTGDVAWLWREDSVLPPGRWLRARVASYGPASIGPCAAPFASAGAVPRVLTVTGFALSLPAGAPVQITRRGRYSIYRASDNAWYLGYRRCDADGPSRCQAVQPVAGPYRVRAGGRAGMQFRYFDSAGGELFAESARQGAWRIDLTVRSDTARRAWRAPARQVLDDSAVVAISMRNAR